MVQANDLKALYDGTHLAIDINENGQHFAKLLDNKDIERILAKPAHKTALTKRLQRDFLRKKGKSTKKKTKNRTKGERKNKKKATI